MCMIALNVRFGDVVDLLADMQRQTRAQMRDAVVSRTSLSVLTCHLTIEPIECYSHVSSRLTHWCRNANELCFPPRRMSSMLGNARTEIDRRTRNFVRALLSSSSSSRTSSLMNWGSKGLKVWQRREEQSDQRNLSFVLRFNFHECRKFN